MSFAEPKSIIEENDTVILYMTPTNMHAIDIKAYVTSKKGDLVENVHQTMFGGIKIKDLVGLKYGSRVSQTLHVYFYWFYSQVDVQLKKCTVFRQKVAFSCVKFDVFRSNWPKDGPMHCNQHQSYGL